MSDINTDSHVHGFPADVNVEGVSPGIFAEFADQPEFNRSGSKRADEMAANREQCVNEVLDAAWPVPDNATK